MGLLVVLCLTTGCTETSGPSARPTGVPGRGTASGQSPSSRPITVEPLGLSFRLPPSFGVIDESEHLFLARSAYPPGVLSIESDNPDVIQHQAEEGESIRRVDIAGVEAVVVSDAVLEGLPPGVDARELLVANGDRSFSLIMSALEPELESLWVEFFGSVTIH